MPGAFKLKQLITGRPWEVGEVHGADEFPPGTDFARLLDLGTIRPMPGTEVHGGDPKVIELLDQVEDLSEALAAAKEHASQQAAQFAHSLKEKDKAIADLRHQLARAQAGALNKEAVGAEHPAPPAEPPAHEVPEPEHHKRGKGK